MPTSHAPSLLVVDDEPDLRTLYELTLLREGYDVESAGSVQEARQCLAARSYDAVISDMRLPDGSGLDLLRDLDRAGRGEKTIVITAHGSAENAVEALKAGAFDYLTKPVDLRQFRQVVVSALGRPPTAPAAAVVSQPAARSAAANAPGADHAPAALGGAPGATGRAPAAIGGAAPTVPAESFAVQHPSLLRLAGATPAMKQVRSLIQRVARGMAPVMVQGESGTGKELVARAIHEVSARASQPFVAVNCSAIPEHLLEAEFFGHRKGAFTGAADDREGFFQAAQSGTLFLDEIGDLALPMQSKLLRVIQERSVRPLGAIAEVPVNARIVSATHKDLAAEVHQGRFRQDLYYRLNVIQIRMPPLRERIDDLPLICNAVLERIARDGGLARPPRLSDHTLNMLAAHDFPGNVRELENLLHRAVALSTDGEIMAADLGLDEDASVFATAGRASSAAAGERLPAGAAGADPMPDALPADLAAYLDQVERDVLERALARHRFNRTAAGASMGLSLRQMRYRMARLGIQGDSESGRD